MPEKLVFGTLRFLVSLGLVTSLVACSRSHSRGLPDGQADAAEETANADLGQDVGVNASDVPVPVDVFATDVDVFATDVDLANADGNGDLDGALATCGDGILQATEQCEDNNRVSGDGCSSDCQLEYHCPPNTIPGVTCFAVAICGDGILSQSEGCDDHNASAGDGCSDVCTLEKGYVCPTIGAPCVAEKTE